MKELEKEAQDWLAKHAVLLGPEELPFEEERLDEAMRTRDGEWPVPCVVPHMGVFADIKDEESFNRIVGEPDNWSIILGRSDLYHAWIVPQAIIIFGKVWFNRKQWGDSMRPGPPPSLFGSNDRRAAREAGTTMAKTPAGRSVILRIVSRIEHALDIYLSGGGRAKSGGIKKPGGYIVRSIANEFIRDAGADLGYRLVRVRACPNCLTTGRGRFKRSEVKHLRDNLYSCERCSDTARNIALALVRHEQIGTPIPPTLAREHERAVLFSEFSGMVCICPNDACQGRFVPISALDDQNWLLTSDGQRVLEAVPQMRILKGIQRFRNPPESLMVLPLRCPFCDERFTPAKALAMRSGFRGQSGNLTGLPSIFVWVRTLDHMRFNGNCEVDLTKLRGALVDESNVDPSHRIVAEQRVRVLVGELAIHARALGEKTAPAVISRCFYEAMANWMLDHPEDASCYFFDWTSGERTSTAVELNRTPQCETKKTTTVVRGHEAAIHQTILYAWLGRISERLRDIRKIKGSKMRSLEDLKWFCHPPVYKGGPKSSFTAIVDEGLRIPNESGLVATDRTVDKPRIAWVLSIRRIDEKGQVGPNLVQHMRVCEWQSIRMSTESGLEPGNAVKVVAIMMPGHHCHAPIQRIVRLRASLLSSIISRIRSEETGETSDALFWQEWHKCAEAAKKATGIR